MKRHIKRIVNCRTCGTGKNWWHRGLFRWKCSVCGGNPFKAGSGRRDWEAFLRARMVNRVGTRLDGDVELLERYKNELAK